jgi:hypothetical protein
MSLDMVFTPEGRNRRLDIAAVDRVIDSIPENGRSITDIFVAWFLKNHGVPRTRRNKSCAAPGRSTPRLGTATSPITPWREWLPKETGGPSGGWFRRILSGIDTVNESWARGKRSPG